MADIFDEISIRPETKKGDIFDQVETVRPLQRPQGGLQATLRQPGAFRWAGDTGIWDKDTSQASSLIRRFGKKLYNVLGPDAIRGIISQATKVDPGAIKHMRKAQEEVLAGKLGPEEAERMRKSLERGKHRVEKLAPLPVPPPETWKESGVDIGVGVAGFLIQVAALKRGMPKGTSPAAVWEVQNLLSGGTPGMGAASYAAFSTPGKIIKGTSLAVKAGRITAESAALMGVTAIEQKMATGELQWQDIAVSGLIPGALRLPRAAKFGLSKLLHKPLVSGRITSLQARRTVVEIANKAKQTGIPIENIIGNIQLRGRAPRIVSRFPQKIKDQASLEQLGNAIKEHMGLGDWHIVWKLGAKPKVIAKSWTFGRTTVVSKPGAPKIAEITISQPSGVLIGRGVRKVTKATAGRLTRKAGEAFRHTQGQAKRTIVHELGHLAQRPYLTKRGKRIAHSKEFADWVNTKVNELFERVPGRVAPVPEISRLPTVPTIDTANKVIGVWSEKAKMLNKTERKAAVHKLRQKQAAISKERYKLEREAGTPRLLAMSRARRASKGLKAKNPEIEPLKLTPEQQDLYGRRIEQVYPTEYQFQRTGAAEAILKMQEGRIPTNYEFGLLEPIFGRDATKKLFSELIKKRPFSGWELPALIIQGFKTKFGLDIQMFRQARSLAVRHPLLYLKSSWVNARAYLSNKYAERMFTQVKNSPGYMESEKLGWNYVGEAGYSSKRLEYYALGLTERLLTAKGKIGKPLRAWGRLLGASERGAVAGINNMQKGLYDQAAKNVRRLNLTPAQQKLWMKNRAKTHNTFMKILRAPPGKKYQGLRRLKQVANYLLFSPSMTVGRPWSIKALLFNKGSRKYAAGVIASNIASIYAITAIPTIIGHQMRLQNPEEEPDVNGELNVLDGMWGKIRYGEEVFDFSGGDAPFYRTLARIGVSSYMQGRGAITGEEITEIAGKRIPSAGETMARYFETRETAALGYAKTMLTGKDWMGEPIPRLEATTRALSPELIEAVVEAGMADGLWGSLASFAGASTSVGVTTYPVKAAATRSKFRDIVSQTKHGMDWDELSMSQQNRLRSEHRKQFEALSERVRKERVERPLTIEKIKEEELRAGKRITSMLSKPNRQWVEDVSIGVSRRPKNWYLTDKRYNRYQELVAQYADERLSKIDFTGMEDKRRIARVQVIVRVAKDKALATLRREVGR